MESVLTAEEILKLIQNKIVDWHKDFPTRPADYVIVKDEMKRRKNFNEHRNDMTPIVEDLALAHVEMWHEEDKNRSGRKEIAVPAVRNLNVLNVYRSELVEELDELFLDLAKERKGN